mgnify:FL=1
MYCVKKMTDDMYWVGANDRRLALFENLYPIPAGVSYNAYLILDEKTVLIDTVDKGAAALFFENIEKVLAGRSLDYLIINHMEPDHAAAIGDLIRRYPDLKIVSNAKAITMIRQYFDFDVEACAIAVKEGEILSIGRHVFRFLMAPMVHWPETMVTYDEADRILYSGDAFGTFCAVNGNLYADEMNFERDWLPDARRYYANIVGKYGAQVQALLKKAAGLEIAAICPLHGPVWRKDLDWFIGKYDLWSSWQPEEQAVMIACGSIYGHTENAAEILAFELAEAGVRNIVMYDVSSTDVSHLVAEAFRCSHLVLACSTHNAEIFPPMHHFLLDLKAHNMQNRTVALIENGTWASSSGKLMAELLSGMKTMDLLEGTVSLRSAATEDQRVALRDMAQRIAASLNG